MCSDVTMPYTIAPYIVRYSPSVPLSPFVAPAYVQQAPDQSWHLQRLPGGLFSGQRAAGGRHWLAYWAACSHILWCPVPHVLPSRAHVRPRGAQAHDGELAMMSGTVWLQSCKWRLAVIIAACLLLLPWAGAVTCEWSSHHCRLWAGWKLPGSYRQQIYRGRPQLHWRVGSWQRQIC